MALERVEAAPSTPCETRTRVRERGERGDDRRDVRSCSGLRAVAVAGPVLRARSRGPVRGRGSVGGRRYSSAD